MGHVETLVGRTSKPAVCIVCNLEIALGSLATYSKIPPKGSSHFECHLCDRRKR